MLSVTSLCPKGFSYTVCHWVTTICGSGFVVLTKYAITCFNCLCIVRYLPSWTHKSLQTRKSWLPEMWEFQMQLQHERQAGEWTYKVAKKKKSHLYQTIYTLIFTNCTSLKKNSVCMIENSASTEFTRRKKTRCYIISSIQTYFKWYLKQSSKN